MPKRSIRRPVRSRRPSPKAEAPTTLALETYVRRSFNYHARLVDAEGLPYFNVFCEGPAEAAHDWPDFGDVMPRQLQALALARHMTGERLPIERTWHGGKKVSGTVSHALRARADKPPVAPGKCGDPPRTN